MRFFEFDIVIRRTKDFERNEDLGIKADTDYIGKCAFDLEQVISFYGSNITYNDSELEGTIVDLKGGDSFGILCDYDDFKQLLMSIGLIFGKDIKQVV